MNKIAAGAKISLPIISRFMSDDAAAHRDIRMEKTADRLAAFLGLELVPAASIATEKRVAKKAAKARSGTKK